MNFTDKDKMLARNYREAGYNWVTRSKNGTLWIYVDKPYRNSFIRSPFKKVDKRNFKPVQFSDSEPTRLDDIISSQKM